MGGTVAQWVDPELSLLSVQSFACSPCVSMGLLSVLQFHPTSQRHSGRWTGYARSVWLSVWMCVCVCMDWHVFLSRSLFSLDCLQIHLNLDNKPDISPPFYYLRSAAGFVLASCIFGYISRQINVSLFLCTVPLRFLSSERNVTLCWHSNEWICKVGLLCDNSSMCCREISVIGGKQASRLPTR